MKDQVYGKSYSGSHFETFTLHEPDSSFEMRRSRDKDQITTVLFGRDTIVSLVPRTSLKKKQKEGYESEKPTVWLFSRKNLRKRYVCQSSEERSEKNEQKREVSVWKRVKELLGDFISFVPNIHAILIHSFSAHSVAQRGHYLLGALNLPPARPAVF